MLSSGLGPALVSKWLAVTGLVCVIWGVTDRAADVSTVAAGMCSANLGDVWVNCRGTEGGVAQVAGNLGQAAGGLGSWGSRLTLRCL